MSYYLLTGILCSFRLVLIGKTRKDIFKHSRLKCPAEKISENNFASLDKKYSTYRPSDRAGIADLKFLRSPLAIYQNL